MGQLPLGDLTQRLIESLFGVPRVVMDMVRMWCRTLHRANSKATLGELLLFLATAPANPCVRDHRVGSAENHEVHFYPFGTHGPLAAGLRIPLVNTDVRVTRAIQLLLASKTAFPQVSRDPVFGYRTYYCFTYTNAAQRKLDECRPVFVASAVCAVATQIRLDVVRLMAPCPGEPGKVGVLPRVRHERETLRRPLTYYQAECEDRCLKKIQAQIKSRRNGMTPYQKLGYLLLGDAMAFVLKEKTAESMQYKPGMVPATTMHMAVRTYPALPDADQILQFGQESTQEWLRSLSMLRITGENIYA